MDSITLLGRQIPVELRITDPSTPVDEADILAMAQSMAALINSKVWDQEQADAFRIMNRIVFFQGKVLVDQSILFNGQKIVTQTEMDRPCCDEDDAIFYWKISEFLLNRDDDVHANTYFHDCWHVVQFRRTGTYARTELERIEREVDATSRQIRVAETLGCSEAEIQHLVTFSADPVAIGIRLAQGVGTSVPRNAAAPHLPGAMSHEAVQV